MNTHSIIKTEFFYCESVSHASSYELKSFVPQYEEKKLAKYLKAKAKEHEEELIERTYIVRDNKTGALAAWFSMQSSTLPYQEVNADFHIPAIELTNFAVDARYHKNHAEEFTDVKIGEYVFFNFIIPISHCISKLCGCRDIFIFALNKERLLKYYQNTLGFKCIESAADFIEMPVAGYSDDLVFMYQTLQNKGCELPEIEFNDGIVEI